MDLSQFTIVGEQSKADLLKAQNSKLIKLRWIYLSVLTGVAVASNAIAGHSDKVIDYAVIGVVGLLLNALFYGINTYGNKTKRVGLTLMLLQLTLDITVATVSTYNQGGIDARTTALYALPIVATGLIFNQFIVNAVAVVSGLSYVSALISHSLNHNVPIYGSELLVPVVFYPTLFLVLAQLVVRLTDESTKETRNKAYDSFLALLSHQLKHPVSTASAIIDMLEHEHIKTAPKDKKYILMLKNENRNLLLLLNNLLETAAPRSNINKYDETDISKIAQEISYLSAETHGRVSDLKFKADDMSLVVLGSGERLKTALANIINNAFQYSKSGNSVTLRLEKTPTNVVIIVENKGASLDRVTRGELFQKYNINQKSEHGVEGLGLGLFVARKIIADHHGSLNIVSDKTGTKAIITLKRGDKRE